MTRILDIEADMAGALAIKNTNGDYELWPVATEVYYYVRQLEEYIKNPEYSRLLEVYPERFGKKED